MGTKQWVEDRFSFFVEHGYLEKEEVPSLWQIKVGWFAMLPITLSESPRERAQSRLGWMSQIPIRVPLQILFNPRQIIPDTGLRLRPKHIMKHMVSVYHEDAFLGYDLQLLQSHPGALPALREYAKRIVDNKTIWAKFLKKVCSWPGYHKNLIELAEAAEEFHYPDPLDLDQRFVSLVGFAKFCCKMPDWPDAEFYGFDFSHKEDPQS